MLSMPPEATSLDWQGRPQGILPETVLPAGFVADSLYPTQPLGNRVVGAGGRSSTDERFLVRGSIEVVGPDGVPDVVGGIEVHADPMIDTFSTCFDDLPLGLAADVASQLDTGRLHAAGLDGDGVAIAVTDGGINLDYLEARLGYRPSFDRTLSWQPPGVATAPGEFPVGHATMCAYAALIAAPNATLVDLPALVGTPAGGAPIGRRLSTVYQAIAHLSGQWSIAFNPTGQRRYKALVVTNSFGMYHPSWDFPPGHAGRYSDNPLHVFTRTIAAMSEIDGIDVVFAAGNCGGDCPDPRCQGVTAGTITGTNAIAQVLTVGGCDVRGARVGYSALGPGVSGMAREKPDLLAFTHFHGSEALGTGLPDKGTSTACPVAAGCIAALRTKALPADVSPLALNQVLRESARRMPGAEWSSDVGYGVIDPVSAARLLALIGG
jgi:serine protease AprX